MVDSATSSPTWKPPLIRALNQYDFEEADEILGSSRYRQTSPERQLCQVGMDVLQLDAEEFAKRATDCAALPATTRDVLAACAWPRSSTDTQMGALLDLRPTYGLLLELLEINYSQRNWTDVLALIHLMAEYLPLLAWQPVLHHAGVPRLMAERFGSNAAAKPRPDDGCALGALGSRFADRIAVPPSDDAALRTYLQSRHSRVSNLLIICGGTPPGVLDSATQACRHQCSVVTGPDDDLPQSQRDALAVRVTLARRFSASPLVQLRHSSPVGHFFAVPGAREINRAWASTRTSLLTALNDAQADESQRALINRDLLPGLRGLIGLSAGADVAAEPSNVLCELRDAITASIEAPPR